MAQTQFTVGDLTYETTSGSEVEVHGCIYSATSVVIPETVANEGITYSVTSIGDSAFYDRSNLTSVEIPNSVTSIRLHAFSGCSRLTSVEIPNRVSSIGDSAFYSCSRLTTLTIGENVSSIGRGAFNGCSSLQNVTCLAINPPALGDNATFPYPNIATLTVPCGSLEAYSAPTSFWNMLFTDRIEEDCGGETGLEDLNAVEISFFPNPANSKVTFNQAIERIELIDLMGKTLRTFRNESEINIEQLPAGVYYLRLTNNEKQTLRKLIKE
ncbi:MAG: leucine-rich repeat domain-containing protein [Bacteroidales bacterium]|nr:leucine-rich repeat domain-containing protein [Bacteroidales bacterium]